VNLWEYLNGCGFWQWMGNCFLALCLAAGLSGLIRITVKK
jgi:hypothetical protein